MLEVKIPGKLYLAGEYNVLNKGGNAVLVSVNRFLTVNIKSSEGYSFESAFNNYKWIVMDGIPQFNYNEKDISKYALLQVFKYLKYLEVDLKPFSINVVNDLFYKGQKLGLGSSSAITLGIIKAVLLFHNIKLDNLLWFKLSVLSQVEGNYLSSGGDLASSIYGGYTYYERYDLIWLLQNKGNYKYILENDWPSLVIQEINASSNFKIKGIWSQKPHLNSNAHFNMTLDKSVNYKNFITNSNLCVNNLKTSLETDDYKLLFESIIKNDYCLKKYHTYLKQKEYYYPFKWFYKMRDQFDLAGKISGAGFGDFAVIVYHEKDTLINHQVINKAFNKYGLIPFDFEVFTYSEE